MGGQPGPHGTASCTLPKMGCLVYSSTNQRHPELEKAEPNSGTLPNTNAVSKKGQFMKRGRAGTPKPWLVLDGATVSPKDIDCCISMGTILGSRAEFFRFKTPSLANESRHHCCLVSAASLKLLSFSACLPTLGKTKTSAWLHC